MFKEVKKQETLTNEEELMKENKSFEDLGASFMSPGWKNFVPSDMCRGL